MLKAALLPVVFFFIIGSHTGISPDSLDFSEKELIIGIEMEKEIFEYAEPVKVKLILSERAEESLTEIFWYMDDKPEILSSKRHEEFTFYPSEDEIHKITIVAEIDGQIWQKSKSFLVKKEKLIGVWICEEADTPAFDEPVNIIAVFMPEKFEFYYVDTDYSDMGISHKVKQWSAKGSWSKDREKQTIEISEDFYWDSAAGDWISRSNSQYSGWYSYDDSGYIFTLTVKFGFDKYIWKFHRITDMAKIPDNLVF